MLKTIYGWHLDIFSFFLLQAKGYSESYRGRRSEHGSSEPARLHGLRKPVMEAKEGPLLFWRRRGTESTPGEEKRVRAWACSRQRESLLDIFLDVGHRHVCLSLWACISHRQYITAEPSVNISWTNLIRPSQSLANKRKKEKTKKEGRRFPNFPVKLACQHLWDF